MAMVRTVPRSTQNSLLRWSSLDTIIEPQQDYQIMQDASSLATWSGNQQAESNSWNALTAQEYRPTQEAEQQAEQEELNIPVFDNWTMPGQSGDNSPVLETQPGPEEATQQAAKEEEIPVNQLNQQSSWFPDSAAEEQAALGDEDPARSSNAHSLSLPNVASTWEETPAKANFSSPPAWLDMLTREEQHRQPNDSTPTLSADAPTDVELSVAEPSGAAHVLNERENETSETSETPAMPQQDDESDYFFGPDWLKSLGATAIDTMDDELPSASQEAQELQAPVPTSPLMKEAVTQPVEPEPVAQQPASEVEPITPFFGWIPEQPAWEEQTVLANAEQPTPEVAQPSFDIEPDSAPEPSEPSEPFVPQATETSPAAPEQKQRPSVEAWLAEAAQKLSQPEQNLFVTLEELEKDLHSQGFAPLEPGALAAIAQEEPTLSSALAQLGNYEQQAAIPTESTELTTPDQAAEPQKEQEEPVAAPVAPLWPATPEPIAQENAAEQEISPVPAMPSHLDMLSSFTSSVWPKTASGPLPAAEPQVPAAEQVAQPVARVSPPASVPTASSAQTPTPMMRPDALLDMELETTMKRPAVRLQPIQPQRSGATRGGNAGERPAYSKPTSSADLTHKERLLKGYQFQLAGAYDNAMQEYRIIIRNAPELLDEVVSNMRALLKLAPKYSAGYRVLGDAYMRQGEYLQAMEAYNKALTMAKKAKS